MWHEIWRRPADIEGRLYTIEEIADLISPDFREHAEMIPTLFVDHFDKLQQIVELIEEMDPYCILPLICTLFDGFCERAGVANREAVFNMIYFQVVEMNKNIGPMYDVPDAGDLEDGGEASEP